jgi:LysW-gamma-L-lysine carboxypeptidase
MNPVNFLEQLLRLYSPTGDESQAVAFLVEMMHSLGFSARADEVGNAVGSIGNGPHVLLLLGHIDTVSGEIEPRRESDLLYGRGAVDAKGPLACFVAAAAQARLGEGWKVVVVGAVGEEGDSRGARYLVSNFPKPDVVVIGEPSGWERIALGYKGSLWLRYSTCRELAHTGAPGESACEAAVDFWNRIQAAAATFNLGRQRVFDQLSPALRGMRSSEDGFEERAQIRIGIRIPEGVSPQEWVAQFIKLPGAGDIAIEDAISAYRAEKNTPLVRALLAGIRKQRGEPGFTVKSGTSDMNIVGPAWNCPIAAYGPGDSSLDHTPKEHMRVSEFLTAIQVLTQAIEQVTH